MKNLVKVVAVSALALSTSQVMAATGTFNATIEVTQAIEFNAARALDFGSITTLDNTDITVAPAAGALLEVSGTPNATLTITPPVKFNLVHTNTTDIIEVGVTSVNTLTLDSAGNADLEIGGTAKISTANLVAGTYSANVDIDVVY